MRDYFNEQTRSEQSTKSFIESGSASEFLRQVYTIMAIGLAITGAAAWFVGTDPNLINLIWGAGFLKWIVMFAPLGVVIFLSARFHKMSYQGVSTAFAIYSLINGISLSFIFAVYSIGSIWQTFLITAVTFGTMALIGITTKIDLSKFGSILFMALIGLIIASVVNIFMGSSMMDLIISGAGVLIFCGLTAYDNQKLIRMGAHADLQNEQVRKYTVMGALELYLDFINLFLFLLRFFGDRD